MLMGGVGVVGVRQREVQRHSSEQQDGRQDGDIQSSEGFERRLGTSSAHVC